MTNKTGIPITLQTGVGLISILGLIFNAGILWNKVTETEKDIKLLTEKIEVLRESQSIIHTNQQVIINKIDLVLDQ